MKAAAAYRSVLGLQISGVSRNGANVALALRPRHSRALPQCEGSVTFESITAVRDFEESAVSEWHPSGQLVAFTFAQGIAAMSVNTYSPGNIWTTDWRVECAAVHTSTRLLAWPTLKAALNWAAGQWTIWVLVVLLVLMLVARLAHWR